MSAQGEFTGRTILVVEDEYYIADDLATALQRRGATVLGPVGTVEKALDLVGAQARIDAAILDINLRGEMSFAVSDALRRLRVPFVFATGYGEGAVPNTYSDVGRWEKPYDCERLVAAVGEIMERRRDRS